MAATTLQMTFQAMQIRVAEYLGIADYSGGASAAPSDTHDLEIVKRIVNDGYRRFVSERDWNFLNPISSITLTTDDSDTQIVNSEIWRYFMPAYSTGEIVGPITYASNGRGAMIRLTNESVIRELRSSATSASGRITLAAVRPLADSLKNATTGVRFELVVWPDPGAAETLYFRTKLWPDALSGNTDTIICGWQHERTVLAAAIAEAERQRTGGVAEMEASYQQALVASIRQDDNTRPRRLGDYGDKSDCYIDPRALGYSGVSTYNGVDISEYE